MSYAEFNIISILNMLLKLQKKFVFTKKEYLKSINGQTYRYNSSTPSIIEYKDGYLMNVRYPGYFFPEPSLKIKFHIPYRPINFNKILILDKDFKIKKQRMIKLNENLNNYPEDVIVGTEDIKLFNDKKSKDLLFIGTIGQKGGKHLYRTECGFGLYTLEGGSLIINRLNKKDRRKVDKNWVFYNYKVNSNWELRIIYEWYPLKTYEIEKNVNEEHSWDLKDEKITKVPERFKHFRGSSCGYNYKNEIWFICHTAYGKIMKPKERKYYHVFVIFDEEMNLLRYSNEIKLSKTNIEFSLGLIVEDDRVLVTYSQLDKTSELAIYSKKYIDRICIHKGDM